MLPDLPKAESQTVEFKTNFNEDVPQTLTAFANAKGGSVFVGVGDSGEVSCTPVTGHNEQVGLCHDGSKEARAKALHI